MMAAKQTDEEKIVSAAISAIRKSGWHSLSLTTLAKKSKLPIDSFYDLCPDRASVLRLIVKQALLEFIETSKPNSPDLSARDRAFDAVLRWFECLSPVRDVLSSVHDERRGELATIVDFIPVTTRSANWIAECAELPTSGWKGAVITRGLGLLMAETMVVWLHDGDELGKTMAHLDRRLRTLEEWQNTLLQARRNAQPD